MLSHSGKMELCHSLNTLHLEEDETFPWKTFLAVKWTHKCVQVFRAAWVAKFGQFSIKMEKGFILSSWYSNSKEWRCQDLSMTWLYQFYENWQDSSFLLQLMHRNLEVILAGMLGKKKKKVQKKKRKVSLVLTTILNSHNIWHTAVNNKILILLWHTSWIIYNAKSITHWQASSKKKIRIAL